jgi:multimeric flavodoxin WrbA
MAAMKIAVLVAGTNDPSNSSALADAFCEGCTAQGATVERVTIRELQLAHFTLDCYRSDYPHEPDLLRVVDLITHCDGFVVATPIWNFSVPAHLKNLIDRLGAFGLDAATRSKGTLKGKPFFLIFSGGAPEAAWIGLMKSTTSHLPQSLQYFGGSYIGHCFEGRCMAGPGKFGFVVNGRPQSITTAKAKGTEFAKVVETFQRTGKPPVKHQVRSKVMRWGENMLKKFT